MYRRLKDLREDRDFSQKEIGNFLAYTHSAYSKIERGERVLSAEVLIELSSLHNVSTDYLLGLTDCPDRIKYKIK